MYINSSYATFKPSGTLDYGVVELFIFVL